MSSRLEMQALFGYRLSAIFKPILLKKTLNYNLHGKIH